MDPTRSALYEQLFDELAEAGASDLAADLVLAAFEGADALAGVLGGATTPRPSAPQRAVRPDAAAIPGMYLTSISVCGFRGIGPTKTLSLRPGPGLTLVTGRNGSGKSSFAEAVELALTETNERLQRGKIWRDGWRNLHCEDAPRVEVELTSEGAPRPIRVVRAWQADDTDLLAATTTVRLPGETARPLADLPWREALANFRPFLAYSELSGLITDGNAKIFDALGGLLRLTELTDTHTLLQQAHSALDKAHKAVRDGRTVLLAALATSDDPRAKAISAALASKVSKAWDLDSAQSAVSGGSGNSPAVGGSGVDGEVAALRRLTALTVPDPADVADRAARLRSAGARADATAGT
ncbi:ATP-binding protein, partial [Frankia sp. Cppng1_Ct_nod]|uniref:AAA family ATPase n=1 Tax=Frankia sp. Cppng1_Ct_nod TaxID=2897162 RepID=UPI002024A931